MYLIFYSHKGKVKQIGSSLLKNEVCKISYMYIALSHIIGICILAKSKTFKFAFQFSGLSFSYRQSDGACIIIVLR